MKFTLLFSKMVGGYYIELCAEDELGLKHYCDSNIVNHINNYIPITINDYTKILLDNNACIIHGEYYFTIKEDADKTINYLNEKYAVIINLIGEKSYGIL